MRHLTFADFCEALVRVACLMALPTDAELEASEARDAGEYLFALQDGDALEEFISSRKVRETRLEVPCTSKNHPFA